MRAFRANRWTPLLWTGGLLLAAGLFLSLRRSAGQSAVSAVDPVENATQQAADRFVTLKFRACGGFANMLLRFAAIYGVGRRTGRRPFVEHARGCWKRAMPEFAAALPALHATQPAGSEVEEVSFGLNCCRYDDVSILSRDHAAARFLYLRGNIMQSFRYFHAFKPEIRALFHFAAPLREHVRQYAAALFREEGPSHKLCVHTRLGDFREHFLLESRLDFANPAVRFVGERLKAELGDVPLTAVLLGADERFLLDVIVPRPLFRSKLVVAGLSRAADLHFGAAHCDSLLLTASGSTFGWLMGYLQPEERQRRVFYHLRASKDGAFGRDLYDEDAFPPEWRRLRLVDGRVHEEPRWHHQLDPRGTAERRRAVEQGERLAHPREPTIIGSEVLPPVMQ